MDKNELQRYFYEQIPLSKAIEVEVLEASTDRVVLSAPLGPNSNHQGTVFAGSASAVALLAAWGLLYLRLKHEGYEGRIVAARNTMVYEQPITGAFIATAAMPGPAAWQKFTTIFQRKQKARLTLTATLHCNGVKVGELEGEFAALGI